MKKVFCAIAFFACCFSLKAYCQTENTVLKTAISGLKTLSKDHIIEKAYLHFDKPYYAKGDTMYFKAYVTLGERHDLSKASGILYIDLINPRNAISNSIKIQIIDGVGWGDFALPDSLQKGNYRVRAYTKYMQNDADYFFDQTIPVGSISNNRVSESSATSAQTAKADIQFFPEGGELVTGLISKVAFKAIGTNGLGVNVKGVILDNANTEISRFSSSHLGMGIFYFEPEEGKTYKAKVSYADGAQNTVDLPKALSKGIVLAVSDTLNKMSVEVRCNKAYLQDNLNKEVNLLLYSGGLVTSVSTKLDSRVLSMDLPNSKFPSGIVQVTLFSQSGEPLSERLVFVQNPDLLKLAVTSDKTIYKKREGVQIKVNAKNSSDIASSGHFSVSVIDESKVPIDENAESTILTSLLLTADLKGYVEQANYYFANNTSNSRASLDALMLSQGYRRFNWKQLLSDNNSKFSYLPEKTLRISGIEKTTAGLPAAKKDILLRVSINNGVLSQRTDEEGKFSFNDLVFMDGTSFTLQSSGSSKDKNTAVFAVNNEQPGPMVSDKSIPGIHDDVNRNMLAYLENSQEGQSKAYNNAGYRSSNLKGAEHADQAISGDDIRNSTSLLTALNGHLNGVDFIKGIPYLKGKSSSDPMLIVVDGKIKGSYVNLDKINPGSVENVEVLKGSNADIYGIYGNAGVLVINTRLGNSKVDISQQNEMYKYNSKNVVPSKNVVLIENNASYRSSNLGGAGHADQVILGNELKNASSLSSGLNGRARGVDFVNGVPYLSTSTVLSMGSTVKEPMYIMVDGSPTSGSIDNINPNVVETVEVLKGANASIYGNNGGAGVLVITTRQDMPAIENGTTSYLGSLQFIPKGFYKAREFYSPKYENTTTANNRPDLRSTIFWNPELATDKDGNASFDYYNADGHGIYRVVIEGIDNNGNIGRQVYRYKVE
jgi:hypothetical protein